MKTAIVGSVILIGLEALGLIYSTSVRERYPSVDPICYVVTSSSRKPTQYRTATEAFLVAQGDLLEVPDEVGRFATVTTKGCR